MRNAAGRDIDIAPTGRDRTFTPRRLVEMRDMSQYFGPQLQSFLIDVFRLFVWLTILVVVFVPLERLFAAHPQKILRKGIVVDLCYYFLSSLLPALLLSVPIGLVAWAAHKAVPANVLAATAALPLWAKIVTGLLATEVGYYWGHRWSHEIPFLWDFHAIHHSAPELTFWSTHEPIRSTWSSADSARLCRSMCLVSVVRGLHREPRCQ